jgi:putative pyruvate formate lyase activating enzyme
MYICNDCPRKCNVDRSEKTGFCEMGVEPVVARAAVHLWEEPPISGKNGSGTVFFSGCNLKCCFCQNKDISKEKFGKAVTVERLKEIYKELILQGVNNINLVTPTHFTAAILKSLDEPLGVPVVYNCGGYESLEVLKALKGKIDIYIPDLKYADDSLAFDYSAAKNYFETATAAIKEMYRQTGSYKINDEGIMQRGVISRHLVLPGQIENSKRVIDWVSSTFKEGEILFSLMSQFTPNKVCKRDELYRRLTQEEYDEISEYLYASGIEDGFMQELSSAKEEYTPPFDLTGVIKKTDN